MVRYEEDADELSYIGRPPRGLRRGLRWRLLISNYAVFFGSLFFAMSALISMPFIAGIVWTIWNERVIVLIFPLLLTLLLPLLGLAITIGGVRDGLRKIRLLRCGTLGQGTILSCRFNKNDLPFPEYLRRWQESRQPHPPPPRVQVVVRFFLRVWSGWFILMMILSVIMALTALREIALTGVLKVNIGDAHRARMAVLSGWSALAVILGLLIAWLAYCLRFLSVGRGVRAVALGQVAPPSPTFYQEMSCTFEYSLPGGDIFKTEDTVTFISQIGDEPTQPVLYDPARPDRAILVNGLCPRVRAAADGAWEGGEGPRALRRTVLLALCWLGPLLMSYIFWSTIAWFTHAN